MLVLDSRCKLDRALSVFFMTNWFDATFVELGLVNAIAVHLNA